ncbi:hypothetical protein LK07_12595 [Streptomyces pluripotens]|uniref:Uncharacterized protein n=1 Tax=Streptomyces pluripotens TaxID=1355015 RepID=A0A221NZ12_9ACTN|nr:MULTISPECIES: hypothetical protein [Streptomyces]ARP70480.1 hypothetical protein LK06_011470 [Streptomyces pluripotens]ASN24735.1 hypothetical protein LK07_12595 [Streptomyces pluripotens]KIE25398.1 hypothetical protein LK08_19560 [Streptomyces sp. MUSC 125]MCH0561218.1 hypothetical protein [Streptomyces sp. MUM 16J]
MRVDPPEGALRPRTEAETTADAEAAAFVERTGRPAAGSPDDVLGTLLGITGTTAPPAPFGTTGTSVRAATATCDTGPTALPPGSSALVPAVRHARV